MAVPNSGSLSMQDIAQERLNSTYGSGNVSGPISMYNLVNGGNTGGAVTSGNTYPAVNTGCLPNPANRTSAQLPNFIDDMGTFSGTAFYNANIGAATNLAVGDVLFSNSSLTTPIPGVIFGRQDGNSNTNTIAGAGQRVQNIQVNNQGQITDRGTIVNT